MYIKYFLFILLNKCFKICTPLLMACANFLLAEIRNTKCAIPHSVKVKIDYVCSGIKIIYRLH